MGGGGRSEPWGPRNGLRTAVNEVDHPILLFGLEPDGLKVLAELVLVDAMAEPHDLKYLLCPEAIGTV